MTPEFFGVFRRLADRLDAVDIESYYGPTMTDFTRDSAWGQTWDISALRQHVPSRSSAFVLDLGTGDGRVIKRLSDAGVNARFLGVDDSEAAEHRFRLRQRECGFPGEFRRANLLDDMPLERPADAAIFGSVSINSLHTIELLARLFDAARAMLAARAPLILSAYTDEATLNFPALDGVLDVTPYVTADGVERLIWRGLEFTGTVFRHNAFVDRAAEGLPSVLCWERERVWSESDVRHVAEACGWAPGLRTLSSVPDGGAEGFDVATISFVRSR